MPSYLFKAGLANLLLKRAKCMKNFGKRAKAGRTWYQFKSFVSMLEEKSHSARVVVQKHVKERKKCPPLKVGQLWYQDWHHRFLCCNLNNLERTKHLNNYNFWLNWFIILNLLGFAVLGFPHSANYYLLPIWEYFLIWQPYLPVCS